MRLTREESLGEQNKKEAGWRKDSIQESLSLPVSVSVSCHLCSSHVSPSLSEKQNMVTKWGRAARKAAAAVAGEKRACHACSLPELILPYIPL